MRISFLARGAIVLTVLLGIFGVFSPAAFAQQNRTSSDLFYRAKVIAIVREGQNDVAGQMSPFQIVKVNVLNGARKGEDVEIEYGTLFTLDEAHKVKKGDIVIVEEGYALGKTHFSIVDRDRIRPLLIIGAIFLAGVLFFGRLKGFSSLFGLLVSVMILGSYVIPKIVAGEDPLVVSVIGAFAIALISLYLSHGFSKRTSIAVVSTLLTLTIAFILAQLFVAFTKLSGFGSDETFYLQTGNFGNLDFKGLLLGGIIIGVLGVLDDITTAQTAVVDELKKANPLLSFQELYNHALSVGREHIASLVNTLALAYVGASFPLLLLFSAGGDAPLWVSINSEAVAEELVRTLVGSSTLIVAVPISTFLAALYFGKKGRSKATPHH